jgi:hypothetical protein
LLGLPVPQVFVYIDEENKNLVIDGQQRIMTIVYFFEGYFGNENIQGRKQVFRLQGLNEKNILAKKRFIDLSESQQRRLKGSVLRAINIRQLNPHGAPTSVYHIFERLNTGGTPLRPQEIRNCVYRGKLVGVLRKLNEDKNWRKILGRKAFDKHQRDVELILRVFCMAYFFDSYEKPMKDFLSTIMKEHRHADSTEAKRFSDRFLKATSTIISQLGDKPFHVRGPLNSSALDAVFVAILSSHSRLPSDLGDRFKKLLKDKEFTKATFYSTSDKSVIKERFKIAQEFLLD